MLRTVAQRRAVRRAVQTSCQAVNMSEFRLLAERVVDLSPRGMLVACETAAQVGDRVTVSFSVPGSVPGPDDVWFNAEAVVARVVGGQRCHDDGYGAGLEFTYFEKRCRQELLSRLAGFPPPVPKRQPRRVEVCSQELQVLSSVFVSPNLIAQASLVRAVTPRPARATSIPRGAFS